MTRLHILIAWQVLVLALASGAWCGDENSVDEEIPPALESYKGREIAQTMHYLGAPWLVRESREREEECSTLLKALNIREGQVVCDMGCGNGFYTLELAKLVGEKGVVYAVDIQQEMLRLLEDRAKEAKVANIKPVLGSVIDPRLPAESCDLILCVDVYHEFRIRSRCWPPCTRRSNSTVAWPWWSFAWRTPTCRSSWCTR
jgi:SAM-dependent methyltransferase